MFPAVDLSLNSFFFTADTFDKLSISFIVEVIKKIKLFPHYCLESALIDIIKSNFVEE